LTLHFAHPYEKQKATLIATTATSFFLQELTALSPGGVPSQSRHVVEEQWHFHKSLSAFSLFPQWEPHREFGLTCKYFQECLHCCCQSLHSQLQHSTRNTATAVRGAATR